MRTIFFLLLATTACGLDSMGTADHAVQQPDDPPSIEAIEAGTDASEPDSRKPEVDSGHLSDSSLADSAHTVDSGITIDGAKPEPQPCSTDGAPSADACACVPTDWTTDCMVTTPAFDQEFGFPCGSLAFVSCPVYGRCAPAGCGLHTSTNSLFCCQ